jgi:hypothetical protein
MKPSRFSTAASVALLLVVGTRLLAQEAANTSVPSSPSSTPNSAKVAGTKLGGSTPASSLTGVPLLDVPEVKLPPNVVIPDSVKGLITDFRAQAQVYVDRQQVILKAYKGATAAEREQLKQQLKESREIWLSQTQEIRAEMKERLADLKRTLRDSRAVSAGIGEGGVHGRRGGGD